MHTKKLKVYASSKEEMHDGIAWIPDIGLKRRAIVSIKNLANKKKIHCEALQIDNNYLTEYRKKNSTAASLTLTNGILINQWYRDKLGLKLYDIVDFKITPSPIYKLCACLDHPQIVVRVATWLGIISTLLGVLSLYLSVFGVPIHISKSTNLKVSNSRIVEKINTDWRNGNSFYVEPLKSAHVYKVEHQWKIIECNLIDCKWGFKVDISVEDSMEESKKLETSSIKQFRFSAHKLVHLNYSLLDKDNFKLNEIKYIPVNETWILGNETLHIQTTGTMPYRDALKAFSEDVDIELDS